MKVYFIRHGETALNTKHVHQTFEEPLSEKGRSDAFRTGKVLTDKKIDTILTSDLLRARQTAEIISYETGVPVEKNELFRELRRPTSLWGTSHYSVKTVRYALKTIQNREDPSWRLEDGETLFETHVRATKARIMLESLAKKHKEVVVVSHAMFIEILMTFVCREHVGSLLEYLRIFSPLSPIKNTSISCLAFDPDAKDNVCKWSVVSLNDTSHL